MKSYVCSWEKYLKRYLSSAIGKTDKLNVGSGFHLMHRSSCNNQLEIQLFVKLLAEEIDPLNVMCALKEILLSYLNYASILQCYVI